MKDCLLCWLEVNGKQTTFRKMNCVPTINKHHKIAYSYFKHTKFIDLTQQHKKNFYYLCICH